MEMMYLVLAFYNREMSMTVLPEKYPSDQCLKTKNEWNEKNYPSGKAFCIPAPVFKYPSAIDLNKCVQDSNMTIRCPANGAK